MKIRLFLPLLALMAALLAGCAAPRTPFTHSQADIDADAVNNGQKSLVVMRVSTQWGSPAETRWMNVENGEVYKVTSQFGAKTQERATEYDMVTLPPGRYTLIYVMYSDGTGPIWPGSPFAIDPSKAEVTQLGQIYTSKSGSSPVVKDSALRSTGLAKDGKTPLIAGFTLLPGKAVYLGDMVVTFSIKGKDQLPGYYPAGSVAYSLKHDLDRAKLVVGNHDTGMAAKLERLTVTRGALARGL